MHHGLRDGFGTEEGRFEIGGGAGGELVGGGAFADGFGAGGGHRGDEGLLSYDRRDREAQGEQSRFGDILHRRGRAGG